jgi:hypothetical protein
MEYVGPSGCELKYHTRFDVSHSHSSDFFLQSTIDTYLDSKSVANTGNPINNTAKETKNLDPWVKLITFKLCDV